MIDPALLVLFVLGGVVCFLVGYFFGAVFSGPKNDKVEPCETVEDILKREG